MQIFIHLSLPHRLLKSYSLFMMFAVDIEMAKDFDVSYYKSPMGFNVNRRG
jgi:hypothetical protein